MMDRLFTTTSISIQAELYEKAKIQAASTYRTFSQYVCYLIDSDLKHQHAMVRPLSIPDTAGPFEPDESGADAD